MTKILGAFLLFIMVYGCAGPVRHTLTPDFTDKGPRGVVVMPVEWADIKTPEDPSAAGLMRLMAEDKLKAMGYAPVDIKAIHDSAWFKDKSAGEVLSLYDADALLGIKVLKWDRDAVTGYASLRIKAAYSLASGTDKALWSAVYDETDFDLKLDSESNELAVIKAFEPRLQRLTDAVFSTLPQAGRANGQKTDDAGARKYYDWLP